MFRVTCCLLAVGVFTVALRAGDAAARKDLEKLQGAWKVVKAVKDGEPKSGDEVEAIEFVIKGNQMTFKENANDKATTFTLTLDPAAKPAAIDFTKGKESIPGIYKLEGDTLTLCFKPESKDRPKEFESKKKSDVRLMVLERKKR